MNIVMVEGWNNGQLISCRLCVKGEEEKAKGMVAKTMFHEYGIALEDVRFKLSNHNDVELKEQK